MKFENVKAQLLALALGWAIGSSINAQFRAAKVESQLKAAQADFVKVRVSSNDSAPPFPRAE